MGICPYQLAIHNQMQWIVCAAMERPWYDRGATMIRPLRKASGSYDEEPIILSHVISI